MRAPCPDLAAIAAAFLASTGNPAPAGSGRALAACLGWSLGVQSRLRAGRVERYRGHLRYGPGPEAEHAITLAVAREVLRRAQSSATPARTVALARLLVRPPATKRAAARACAPQ